MHFKQFHCQACGGDRHALAYVVEGYPIFKCEAGGVGRVDVDNFDPVKHYDGGYFTGGYKHSYRDYLGSKETISREFANVLPLDLIIQQAGVTMGMNWNVNIPRPLKSVGLPANL